MFEVPFEEIAKIVGRSVSATRQLASRARRRVQRAATSPDVDLSHQRAVVEAFLAAARGGDFEALLALLAPDVLLRADRGGVPAGAERVVRGARAVAEPALSFSRRAQFVQRVLVNGAAGIVSWLPGGRPFAVMGFTVRRDKIVESPPNRNRRKPCHCWASPKSGSTSGSVRLTHRPDVRW